MTAPEPTTAWAEAPDVPGPHRPLGNLFLPVERATDEFQQTFGRPPSLFEVAAGVASRPDLVDPVHPATLRRRGSSHGEVADRWFLTVSLGARRRLEYERATAAAMLLESLGDFEEQVIRARLEPHMTQFEITHAIAFSQLCACVGLVDGVARLDATLVPFTRVTDAPAT